METKRKAIVIDIYKTKCKYCKREIKKDNETCDICKIEMTKSYVLFDSEFWRLFVFREEVYFHFPVFRRKKKLSYVERTLPFYFKLGDILKEPFTWYDLDEHNLEQLFRNFNRLMFDRKWK